MLSSSCCLRTLGLNLTLRAMTAGGRCGGLLVTGARSLSSCCSQPPRSTPTPRTRTAGRRCGRLLLAGMRPSSGYYSQTQRSTETCRRRPARQPACPDSRDEPSLLPRATAERRAGGGCTQGPETEKPESSSALAFRLAKFTVRLKSVPTLTDHETISACLTAILTRSLWNSLSHPSHSSDGTSALAWRGPRNSRPVLFAVRRRVPHEGHPCT